MENLESYYARRAAEYEKIFDKPERQADLARMRADIPALFKDERVLEIACGTGYWTPLIAAQARSVVALDYNKETLAIARAILMDPRVLVLDDATASVDATTEAKIRLGLREAMRGRTTLIIAHRLSTISLADEIVVLEHGRVAARGSADALRRSSLLYREIEEHGLVANGAASSATGRTVGQAAAGGRA
jgi:ABC-type multidrug transport system fused ATPase/permease subunit